MLQDLAGELVRSWQTVFCNGNYIRLTRTVLTRVQEAEKEKTERERKEKGREREGRDSEEMHKRVSKSQKI